MAEDMDHGAPITEADLWLGAGEAFDAAAMPDGFVDLVRRAVGLMADATAQGYSYVQVLTEADHVVTYANDMDRRDGRVYKGDYSTYGHCGVERPHPEGWQWVVTPRSVREYMCGDARLATISDADLRTSIDFWMDHQDKAIMGTFENVLELVVDTPRPPADAPKLGGPLGPGTNGGRA